MIPVTIIIDRQSNDTFLFCSGELFAVNFKHLFAFYRCCPQFVCDITVETNILLCNAIKTHELFMQLHGNSFQI